MAQDAAPWEGPAAGRGPRLYVYYRVQAAALGATVAAVQAQQTALRSRHPGLHTTLLQRVPDESAAVTLMETYAAPDGVGAALQTEIAAGPWPDTLGGRHVEVFEPCA